MSAKKSFQIYEKRHASGNVGYRVDLGIVKGKRTFKNFPTQLKAQEFRDKHLKAEVHENPNLLVDLNEVTRHEVLAALARLKKYNATLPEAVDYFLKHARPAVADATIQKVMDEWKSVKKKAGLSTKYLETSWASFFVPFRDHFKNCVITDVPADRCEKYVYGQKKWNATTRGTHIRHLSALFNFAIEKGYAALNPFKSVQRPKKAISKAAEKVMPVANVIKLLQYAYNNDYKPECAALVLVLFCGVRTDEVTRLKWEQVKLDEQKPVISLDDTKANRRRVNTIPPNALEWLQLLRGKGNITLENHDGRMRYLRKVSGAGMKQNSARICFASYHVARWEDPNKTSLLLGHHDNPTLLWNTYRALVSKAEAKSYWKITPDYKGEGIPVPVLSAEEIQKSRAARLMRGINAPIIS